MDEKDTKKTFQGGGKERGGSTIEGRMLRNGYISKSRKGC